MEFDTWEPVYEAILADMGYDRGADERARDVLADLTDPFDLGGSSLEGKTVAVAGAGPSLEGNADVAATADAVLAASTAAERLLAEGVDVDCMVTDLDKTPGTARLLTERGVPVAAHAHGDNLAAVREYVPTFEREYVLATTQAAPAAHVRNFGGFTDGDRAAFLADHLGAAELCFPGWDFDDPHVTAEKRAKLRWAERLLYWLEVRRDDQFAILDGRREEIDTAPLPL